MFGTVPVNSGNAPVVLSGRVDTPVDVGAGRGVHSEGSRLPGGREGLICSCTLLIKLLTPVLPLGAGIGPESVGFVIGARFTVPVRGSKPDVPPANMRPPFCMGALALLDAAAFLNFLEFRVCLFFDISYFSLDTPLTFS